MKLINIMFTINVIHSPLNKPMIDYWVKHIHPNKQITNKFNLVLLCKLMKYQSK